MGSFFSGYQQTTRQPLVLGRWDTNEKWDPPGADDANEMLGATSLTLKQLHTSRAVDGTSVGSHPGKLVGLIPSNSVSVTKSGGHENSSSIAVSPQPGGTRKGNSLTGRSASISSSAMAPIEVTPAPTTQNNKAAGPRKDKHGARQGGERRRGRHRKSKAEANHVTQGKVSHDQWNDGEWMYNLDTLAREYGPAFFQRK